MKFHLTILLLSITTASYSQFDFSELSFLERSGIQFKLGIGETKVYKQTHYTDPKVNNFAPRKKAHIFQPSLIFSYDLNYFLSLESGLRYFEYSISTRSLLTQPNDTALVAHSPYRLSNTFDLPIGTIVKITPKQKAVISILGGMSMSKSFPKSTESTAFNNLETGLNLGYYLGFRVSTHLHSNWHFLMEGRLQEYFGDMNTSEYFTDNVSTGSINFGLGYRFYSCD